MADETKTQQGQVIDEDDDFDFGNTDKDDADEGADDGSADESGSNEDKDESAESEADDDNESDDGEGDEGSGDGDDEGDGEEDEVDKSTEASKDDKSGKGSEGGKEGEGEGEGKDEPDFFGEEFDDSGEDKKTETVSYKPVAEKLGLELESDSPEEFETKISEKIEAAKQEFKIDEYSPDAQAVIKHLTQNEGKIEDFFNNETIVSLQSVIGLKPEEKVLYIRTNELTNKGMKPDEAREQAESEVEEWSTKEVKDYADTIDTDAKKLINEEVAKVVGNREAIISKQTEKQKNQIAAEKESLKAFVNSQEDFMGMKLSAKAKQNIVQAIDSGEFDAIADKTPEASKFRAYMLGKFGNKIAESFNNRASVENRKGHNAAVDKATSALHKTKASAQKKSTGHQNQSSGTRKNFESWSDDLFEDGDE